MQNRYIDRERYFNELAETSAGYYIDYIKRFKDIDKNSRIMEIGCGEGGNLLPFAKMGCFVAGLDLAPGKIDNARKFFAANGADGVFSCADFLKTNPFEGEDKFDVILIHDVIEHIEPEGKDAFFAHLRFYLKQDGIVFSDFRPGRCLSADTSRYAGAKCARKCHSTMSCRHVYTKAG